MIAPLGQLLIMLGERLPKKKEPAKTIVSPYRARCHDCDKLNLDARTPCTGHS